MHRKADPRAFGGGVALEDDTITAFRPGSLAHASARRHLVFAGAQVLEPELLARIPEGPGDLVTVLYEPLLAEGAPLAAVVTERLWHDLGTPRRYLDGVLDWTFRGSNQASRIVKGAEVDPSATLRRTIVEAGAQVEADADLRRCVVMPGAKIGKGAKLNRSVVGPGATVAPGTEAEATLFTFDPERGETAPRGSRDDAKSALLPLLVFSLRWQRSSPRARQRPEKQKRSARRPAHRPRWSQASRGWSPRSSAGMSRCAASR